MIQALRYLKTIAAAAVLFAGFGIGSPAHAIVPVSVFYLSANCEDCATAAGLGSYGVTGVLTLQSYLPNTPITEENFMSFSYGGSNLVDPYTVAVGLPTISSAGQFSAEFATVSGSIGATPGPYRFALIFDDGLFFQTQTDGNWSTCAPKTIGGTFHYFGGGSCFTFPPTPTDLGNAAVFSMTAPVPEPGVWAMLCAGLGVVACLRRRKA